MANEMWHPLYLRVVLTLAAIAVAVGHAAWPNLRIDGVTLGLIGLAALPWLAPIIKSVELPGVGKIELQEVRAEVEELRGQTASASQKADTALVTNSSARPDNVRAREDDLSEQQFLALAAKYDEIRKTQKPGGLRTGAMTEVVGAMIALAPFIPKATVIPLLTEEDDGKRLSAYAYIYARPEPQLLSELVASVADRETKPFGQYWGIQAIGRVIQTKPGSIDAQTRNSLRSFLTRLKKGTDRYYELSTIIKSLDDSG
jgi:hypothetical protein